ncbi:hypothetical protein [Mariniflexile sp. AS56]|uniref:hypothetical protein n=1 Tax=Mariniflexile sp. AS56 TaxID=3063957 RepID=UPI0026F2AAA4|nr:hypothetical protein [Mariniflexile sp. AS56]MDO7173264.1 hypothetical protein [Mariniflexile sp. AS56]
MNLLSKSSPQIKILLVEQDTEHTNTFLRLAEMNNWLVYTCEGSMQAIRWIKENEAPHVMIIEKEASPLNGFQTHDYIQSELKITIPVLISSDINAISNNRNGLDFINKPFSKESITTINSKIKEVGSPNELDDKDYSLDYLINLSDGNEEFILTSLNIFRDSVAVKLAEINEALLINQFNTIREIAHNIKPSFEILESTIGRDLCNDLVYKATENNIPELVQQLHELYTTIDLQLKNDIPKYA